MRSHPLVALALVAALGCRSVVVTPFERLERSARPVSAVAVLKEAPSAPYRALARIDVRDRGLGRTPSQLRAKLVAAAAGLGADAVVVEDVRTQVSVGGSPQPVGLYDEAIVSGTAIVFEAAPEPAKP